MSFKLFEGTPVRTPYKQVYVNPVSGEKILEGPVYNVISEANNLSDSSVGGNLPQSPDAAQSSTFILHELDITSVTNIDDKDFSLASGIDLNQANLENFEKTSDVNPNRNEEDKFSSLKSGKISVSKVFDQKQENSINEIDENKSLVSTNIPKVPQNLIGITNDFLDYSPQTLVSRVKK
tara:strand:- start:15107 stop:15643 length:537 start_codon:yes stop_codon:yes gene_type:complete